MRRIPALAVFVLSLGTQAAQAVPVVIADHQRFTIGQSAAAYAALSSYSVAGATVKAETFESASVDTVTGSYVSPTVGTFTGLGGTGNGSSVVAPTDQIHVRETSTNIFGRQNLTPDGKRYLDSNDTFGWTWSLDAADLGLSSISGLSFLLMDAGDQKATFRLSLGSDPINRLEIKTIKDRADGSIDFIALSFLQPTTSIVLRFENTVRLNDGFGLDEARVFGQVAPVPLPPAVLMLGSALLGLGVFRRRRIRT